MAGIRLRVSLGRRSAGPPRRGRADHGDAWREGVVNFEGKHYQVDGAIVEPRPLQKSGIPLWVAGGGEKVTLRIAAKYAQYTNFTSEPEGFAHKSQVLAAHCRDVGTDFGAIVRSANINAVVGSTEAEVQDRLNGVRSRIGALTGDAAADAMLNSMSTPAAGSGTPEQIVEALQKLRDLGCDYVICYFPEAAYDRSGLELFEKEIIPALS